MAEITFWEKPGCIGNKKQKEILTTSGHNLDVKDLLSEPWSKEKLRPFFGSMPITEWFNKSNPQVKAGEIDPKNFNEDQALELMVAEPLFIRRPLLQVKNDCRCGFDVEQINSWIGLNLPLAGDEDPQACPHPATPCD